MEFHSALLTSSNASTRTSHVASARGDLSFEVKTGVRQGCVMSVQFNIAINWVFRRTVEDQRRGISWTPFSTLEDLDFPQMI